jgi:ribosome-binding protein aMBF1 (putative translation factor)
VFRQALIDIVRRLDEARKKKLVQSYALVGGFAVSAWGVARATQDIDLAVALGTADPARLAAYLKAGYQPGDPDDPRPFPGRDQPSGRAKTEVRAAPRAAYVSGDITMAKTKRSSASDAVEILHRRHYEGRPERLAALEEARANDSVARKIAALRLEAGLSQRQLAKLVGTTASVICRLESADYEGHSLAMLNRIAAAVNQRVEIRFVQAGRRLQHA